MERAQPPYSRCAHITVRVQKGNHVLKSSAIEDKDLELDWLLQGFFNCDLGRRCLWRPQLWTPQRGYCPTDILKVAGMAGIKKLTPGNRETGHVVFAWISLLRLARLKASKVMGLRSLPLTAVETKLLPHKCAP